MHGHFVFPKSTLLLMDNENVFWNPLLAWHWEPLFVVPIHQHKLIRSWWQRKTMVEHLVFVVTTGRLSIHNYEPVHEPQWARSISWNPNSAPHLFRKSIWWTNIFSRQPSTKFKAFVTVTIQSSLFQFNSLPLHNARITWPSPVCCRQDDSLIQSCLQWGLWFAS